MYQAIPKRHLKLNLRKVSNTGGWVEKIVKTEKKSIIANYSQNM